MLKFLKLFVSVRFLVQKNFFEADFRTEAVMDADTAATGGT